MSGTATGPIRVGVIGCGEIAQLMHLPLLHELTEFSICALCDLSPSTVEHLGDRHGVGFRTTDYGELLASDGVDAVVVCTYDHAPVVAVAIEAGKHVLVEKPLAFTPAEARPLVDAAAASGLVALVGYMKLYDRAVERAIERVAGMEGVRSLHVHDFAGRFDRHGELYTQFRASDVPAALLEGSRRDIAGRIAVALGADHAGYVDLYTLLLMLGSHDLAVLRAVCGAPERVVHAQARGDSQLLAVFEYANGVPCIFEIGVGMAYEWWDEWLAVYGGREELRIEFPNPYIRYAPTVLRTREADDGSAAERIVQVSHDSPFRRELLHFADCINGAATPRTPFADGAFDLELASEIIRALPPRKGAEA
jgi:predicted dehydrogenase